MSYPKDPELDKRTSLLRRMLRWFAETDCSTQSMDTHNADTKREIIRRMKEQRSQNERRP